jgi:EmrB/QacA subfamily drug resistance transporter
MDENAQAAPNQKPSWLILVVLALAQFMLIVDVSIVNIALPSIQKAFSMTDASLQWVLTAYALTFGGFLLLGGRSADYFGRRRTFLAGLVVFVLASLSSGIAQSGTALIVSRAVQGLAGAFMSPAALSMVLVTYQETRQRNIALAVWGAIAAAGGALGVLLGGVFTQYLSWRWNFFVNIPIGIIVFAATLAMIPRHAALPGRKHLDLPGAVLVTGGLMSLVYGLVKAPDWGWTDHRTLIFFGVSVVALVAFVINEAITRYPLMPLRIFRVRNVAGADSLMLLISASVFSSLFIITIYVQELLGYSPIKTGLSFLLFPACIALAATNVPRLVQRIGYRPILIAGPMLMAAGLFMESGIRLGGHYWSGVAPGMVLMALGMGATIVSTTIAATSGVAVSESGLASGLLTTSQQVGGAVGLAAVTAVLTSSTTNYLNTLSSGMRPTAPIVAAATVHGFENGLLAAGYFALSAGILALILIRPAAAQPAAQGAEHPSMRGAAEAG